MQGPGAVSPLQGTDVVLEGVTVTAVGKRGYFVQEAGERTDDDPRTSEGLYVFGEVPASLEAGDRVATRGTVVEFHGHTQLKAEGLPRVLGKAGLPPASEIRATSERALEALESMRVTVPDGLIVSPTDRHGEVDIVPTGPRPLRSAESPRLGALVELDPSALGGPAEPLASPRPFAAEGVLIYRFGDFVIWPTRLDLGEPPGWPRHVRKARPGELVVATYNLRLFFDETREGNEPVVDADAFRRRLSKHAAWLRRVLNCPDVVAVQEVEVPAVLDRLARESGCGYRVATGDGMPDLALGYLIGRDVALEGAVRSVGTGRRMPGSGSRLFDRPPLVAVVRTAGGPVAIVNVHLRSMRGLGREPRVLTKRRLQADALAELVAEAVAGSRRVMVLGDFNALPFDDGYVDVLGRVAAPAGGPVLEPVWPRLARSERYSYLYRGHGQMLDHALADRAVAGWISEVAFARGNADAPAALAEAPGTLLGASDHDPLVIYLRPVTGSR